jgi:hypothetical protein
VWQRHKIGNKNKNKNWYHWRHDQITNGQLTMSMETLIMGIKMISI